MTNPRETLARIRAQADAASPGPWFDEERNLDEPWDLTTVYYGFHNGETPDRDLVAEASYDNAKFIAASRTTMPRLVDALEAVLDLADRLDAEDEAMHDFYSWPRDKSDQTKTPAARIREAITTALEGETR